MLQAEGMVRVQAECAIADAFQFMADRAIVQGMTIEAVAAAVVDHRIRFGPDGN